MLMRATPPAVLTIEEAVQHPVMPQADQHRAVLARNRGAPIRDRVDVMNMQGTPTRASDAGENAATVAVANAVAQAPPGLGVVQAAHE